MRGAQQAALISTTFGGKPEWPSLDERLADFETLLASEPERVNPAELELRDALGLRRPGG